MKTYRRIGIFALSLVLAACQQEKDITLHFRATLAPPSVTKTLYAEDGAGINVEWEAGDRIALVHNGVTDIVTVKAVDGSGAATIEGIVTGSPADNDPVQLVYPAEAVASASPADPFPFTLSDVFGGHIKGQDGTLDFIQENIDLRWGSGNLAVNGSDVSLKAGVSMPSAICIWKFSLQDEQANPLAVTSLDISVGGVSQARANAEAKTAYYLAVVPALWPSGKLTIAAKAGEDAYVYTKEEGASLTAGKYYQSAVNLTDLAFSVSTTTRVRFSPGNLQATYDGSSWTWKFAENQWDHVGKAPGNEGCVTGTAPFVNTDNVTVDLFHWVGASASFEGVSQYGIYSSKWASGHGGPTDKLKHDWGTLMGEGWRTLSGGASGEWKYLLEERAASTVNGTANARYCKAKVNDQKGVVIFPDSYTHPAGPAQPVDINQASVSLYSVANSWSGDSWAAMEAAGCVFLPAAGYRYYDFGTASDVVYYFVVGNGGYWSCTAGGESFPQEAYMLDIADEGIDATAHRGRNQGFSVRLVRDVTQN